MLVYCYPIDLTANNKRVILQSFDLGEERTKKTLGRIIRLSEDEVTKTLKKTFKDFEKRHRNFKKIVKDNFENIQKYLPPNKSISNNRKLLIGLFFSKEYSVEAASLFNPSIVLHPNQRNLKNGEVRFILSLRSTGEGHLSSIEFRTGIIDKKLKIRLEKSSGFVSLSKVIEEVPFNKENLKIHKKYFNRIDEKIYETLPLKFTKQKFLKLLNERFPSTDLDSSDSFLIDYIESNYSMGFPKNIDIGEQVIFPYSKSETVGMEDVRFVKFKEGSFSRYYGTYTAYDGRSFKVQLLETNNFKKFKVKSLHGKAVQDKGMALFPRKINDKYWMISRQGGVNISIMNSDNLYQWDEYETMVKPKYSWEIIQLGNCGSPIEIREGWLLITHAVGTMRKYVISACLLDKNNPGKIIGRLSEPLISPSGKDREGYVPNVVYSCGAIVLNDNVIIPYAKSDSATSFARVSLSELLKKMK